MDSVVYYNSLYDIYGSLLTDKQKKYFEDYYCNNLSFSEMAEDYGVSRNAIFNQVHSVIIKLEEYEEKLRNKLFVFKGATGTKKALQLVMITTYGVKQNIHSGIVSAQLTLDNLFE